MSKKQKCSHEVKNVGGETDGTCNANAVRKYSQEKPLCRLHYHMDRCQKLEEEIIKLRLESLEPCPCAMHQNHGYGWVEAGENMYIVDGLVTEEQDAGTESQPLPSGSHYCSGCRVPAPYVPRTYKGGVHPCHAEGWVNHRVEKALNKNVGGDWVAFSGNQVTGPCKKCGGYA